MFIVPNYDDCLDENGKYSEEKFYEIIGILFSLKEFPKDVFSSKNTFIAGKDIPTFYEFVEANKKSEECIEA